MMRDRRTGTIGFLMIAGMAALAAGCSTTDVETEASDDANYVADAAVEKSDQQYICKRAQPTGSRISERICLTAEEWDKVEEQSRQMLDRSTRKSQQYEDQ